MTGTPLVVLDACALANFSLCDTVPRLAEPPRLFEPKWSGEIIRETTRTLESKLGWPHAITGYEAQIPRMTNDEKDRQPSPLQGRAPGGVRRPRAAPSVLPERDLPPGTGRGHDEGPATGNRPGILNATVPGFVAIVSVATSGS